MVVWACGSAGATLRYGLAATWRSGYAAACKAVYTGSIPVVASAENLSARQLDAEYLPQRDGAAVLTPAGAFASTGAGEAV